MINLYNLFASPIYVVGIDPLSFDKKGIIKTIKENYKRSNLRNQWDNTSKLHHYYNDWDNKDFCKVNTDSLIPVYKNVYEDFLDRLNFKETINYKFDIANITVYKNKNDHMKQHNHMEDNIVFAGVHYISVGKDSAKLSFCNPMSITTYLPGYIKNLRKDKFPNNFENSYLHEFFDLEVLENQMIIFPSYLMHSVKQEVTSTKYRIAIATNLCIT